MTSVEVAEANERSLWSPPVLKPTEVAQLLRSVAMLAPGCASALDRDTAYAVLSQLEELQTQRRHTPHYVFCPYCGEGFDSAHGLRAVERDEPPRSSNPIADADTVGGAADAARAMAKAMEWRNDGLRGPEAFWVDFGRIVLWPLLFLARSTGRDMDDVRLLAYPPQLGETLATVTAELAAMDATIDVERARRQWARIVASDARSQRTAFDYAYAMVHHWVVTGPWEATGPWARPGRPPSTAPAVTDRESSTPVGEDGGGG